MDLRGCSALAQRVGEVRRDPARDRCVVPDVATWMARHRRERRTGMRLVVAPIRGRARHHRLHANLTPDGSDTTPMPQVGRTGARANGSPGEATHTPRTAVRYPG